MKLKSHKFTTRNDFNPGYVLGWLELDRPLDIEDCRRIITEACHLIAAERYKMQGLKNIINSLKELADK